MKTEARKTLSERVIAVRVVYSDIDANTALAEGWRMFGLPSWSETLMTPVFFMVLLDQSDAQ